MSLQGAVEVLNAQAEGLAVNRSQLISAALSLRAATVDSSDPDLLDAAVGLECLATGGELNLNEVGRRRAGQLAKKVAVLAAVESKH
jgi:hypothetical protein